MMSLCINCNRSAHHFCAEYLSEQTPDEESIVITVKDFSKEGKFRYHSHAAGPANGSTMVTLFLDGA